MVFKSGEEMRKDLEIDGYNDVLSDVSDLLEGARRGAARRVNSIMTATYWLIGKRIVECEQEGASRAEYGEALILQLSKDLTARFGRGFSARNISNFRMFYLLWPILQTVSAKSAGQIVPTVSALSECQIPPTPSAESPIFLLSWSHYVRLLSVDDAEARKFYETEAIRGGWSVRQLDRQISSKYYERILLSRKKEVALQKGTEPKAAEKPSLEEEIRDPYILEFLNLKDEYSETDLEQALIENLEAFLLELGGDFTFVGRQRRLRIGDEWYRIDLLFFHRRLKCLIIIDLKVGKFTHADAGQMHLYLNYAREHWVFESENPPVGLILCSEKDDALVRYALEGLPNKVVASEYRMKLPAEKILVKVIEERRKYEKK
jgi:predicted nuclease of restriction endonuclease-like (RecB) superfamily